MGNSGAMGSRGVRIALLAIAAAVVLAGLRATTLIGVRPDPRPSGPSLGDESPEIDLAARPQSGALARAPRPTPSERQAEVAYPSQEARLPLMEFEDADLFGVLRRALDSDPLDERTTRAQRAWAENALETNGLPYLYFDVECTRRLCRAEMGFDTIFQVRDLGRIQLPEGFSIIPSEVFRRDDRPGLSMILYWGVDGLDLTSILAQDG